MEQKTIQKLKLQESLKCLLESGVHVNTKAKFQACRSYADHEERKKKGNYFDNQANAELVCAKINKYINDILTKNVQ